MRRLIFRLLIASFFLIAASKLFAQELPDTTLVTPYDAVYTHLFYLQPESRDVDLAAKTVFGFDDPKEAREVAIKIKQVLDGKGLYVRLNTIPKDSLYRDSLTNQSKYVLFPANLPEVAVERVGKKWVYAQETIDRIGEIHSKTFPYGSSFLMNMAPKFGTTKILGLALWQYLGLLLIILGSILLYKIFSWILRTLINWMISSRWKAHIKPEVIWRIAKVLSLLIILQIVRTFVPSLLLPIELSAFVNLALKIVGIAFVVVLALRIVDFIMGYFSLLTEKTTSKLDDQLLPIIRKFLQFIFVAAGIIQGLNVLEVNITALIAGVSIGGLAVALAAQDTVKNLIGSFMIFLDKPFQIGDYVNLGTVAGVVEEVGFRSTLLRGTDTSIHSVPNGTLANMMINNLGLRTFRRYRVDLGITYDTPPNIIEIFVDGIREIVTSHPNSRVEGWEVHLNDFAASSLNIIINGYFEVPGWTFELQTRHEVMMAIIKLADALGVRFAFPSQTLYIEEFPEKIGNVPHFERDIEKLKARSKEVLDRYHENLRQEEPQGDEV